MTPLNRKHPRAFQLPEFDTLVRNHTIISVITGLFLIITPKASPALLLMMVISIFFLAYDRKINPLAGFPLTLQIILVLFSGYLAINSFWAFNISGSLQKWAITSLFLICLVLIAGLVAQMPDAAVKKWKTGFLIGILISIGLLLFQIASDQLLTRLLKNSGLIPIQVHKFDTLSSDGQLETMGRFHLNQSVTIMALMIWPIIHVIGNSLKNRTYYLVITTTFLLLTGIAIFSSVSETAKVAYIVSILIFLLSYFYTKISYIFIVTGFLIAFLIPVPIAKMIYNTGLHQVEWLQTSLQQRFVIWKNIADEVDKKPVLGAGLYSTRYLTTANMKKTYKLGQQRNYQPNPMHPHNNFLQVWYELGLIGVLLFTATGLTVLHRIWTVAPKQNQPFMMATFTACLIVISSGFGLWQSWIWSSVILIICFMLMSKPDSHEAT